MALKSVILKTETGNIDTYVMGSWEPTAKDNSGPAQPIYQGAKINIDKVFSSYFFLLTPRVSRKVFL